MSVGCTLEYWFQQRIVKAIVVNLATHSLHNTLNQLYKWAVTLVGLYLVLYSTDSEMLVCEGNITW